MHSRQTVFYALVFVAISVIFFHLYNKQESSQLFQSALRDGSRFSGRYAFWRASKRCGFEFRTSSLTSKGNIHWPRLLHWTYYSVSTPEILDKAEAQAPIEHRRLYVEIHSPLTSTLTSDTVSVVISFVRSQVDAEATILTLLFISYL